MIHRQLQQLPNFEYAKEAADDLGREKRKASVSAKNLLWQDHFRDPLNWLDSRSCTCTSSPRHADFKHRLPREPWVIEDLRSREPCHDKPEIDALRASLRACTRSKDLVRGAQIHDELVEKGLIEECAHALVLMYAKCGELEKAQELLHTHKSSSTVLTWTALITACVREGHCQKALNCFEQMQQEGLLPDAVTFICILKACSMTEALEKGKQVHEEISKQGLLQNDIVLGNALVDMYAKCGALLKARQVLYELPSRDVVSWSAMISGYVQRGRADQALNCFEEMQRDGILPNEVTFICVLKACAMMKAADKGKQIHEEIMRQGLLQTDVLLGGALVDMYAKCGAFSQARQVLDKLPSRDVVSWSALIVGFAQGGRGEQALECFEEMRRDNVLPNAVTFIGVLKACAMIGAVDQGEQIHDKVARQGLLENDIVLGGALVDMYAKCGAISKARQVLDGLPARNVIVWNALIAGCAQRGHAEEALNSFEEMLRDSVLPNAVTFISVLNVCSHQGLVEEGQAIFSSMRTKYGVKPSLECYACMVDLYGRAGHLEKAVRLIKEMQSSEYSVIWRTLLGACRRWSDVSVGRWAFEQAVKLDKRDGPAYVLMSDIYAIAGMEQEALDIEAMRIRNKAWKMSECSVGTYSSNAVGDMKHMEQKYMNAMLVDSADKMTQHGYSPGAQWVSPGISDAGKAHLSCWLSEKPVRTLALINS